MPKLLEAIGGTETKICIRGNIRRPCVLAVSLTIKLGLTKVRNHAKPLNILDNKIVS